MATFEELALSAAAGAAKDALVVMDALRAELHDARVAIAVALGNLRAAHVSDETRIACAIETLAAVDKFAKGSR